METVHQKFMENLANSNTSEFQSNLSLSGVGLTPNNIKEIFESQILSRQLDRIAKKLQAEGEGFYTIGSSGHESMAAVAAAFKVTDMAFLHYRDAAFQIQRSKQLSDSTPALDMLLSFAASSDDPISGGRHKVLGSKRLNIPPQTSTIASHLPKAVGTAYSIGLSRRHPSHEQKLRDDSVIICSFGDASVNHSTAQGAFNTALWASYQNMPMPIVFVCEDNNIGISTKTPIGWIEANFISKPGLQYIQCDGSDSLDTFQAAKKAERYARSKRKPVFLHIKCVRLSGHAGADVQSVYLSPREIEDTYRRDPLLHTAREIIRSNIMSLEEIFSLVKKTEQELEAFSIEVKSRPKLASSKEVMSSLIPPVIQNYIDPIIDDEKRTQIFERDTREMEKPQHMARLLSWALADLLLQHNEIIVAGEDVAAKGGVYGVTSKLHSRFGSDRVINTLLDEQSILGLGIGLAHNGFLPITEIQFLAYLHNAEDQLRGEAATLSFFSNGQYTNPMIIRIAGLAYQKGFGGHFHNDNSLAVIRDIPGIIIACPSNGDDAVKMLRECVRLAKQEQRIAVFIEPIALYMTRDLHQPNDGLWSNIYPSPKQSEEITLNDITVYESGNDLAILSYANGYFLSRQAEKILYESHEIGSRVIDIRWIAPLAEESIIEAVSSCSHILIVDECRQTGSQSEALYYLLKHRIPTSMKISRITAEDSFIPLGKAATVTLPGRDSIVSEALRLVKNTN